MANAEIRSLQFNQGVGIAIPAIDLASQSDFSLSNNVTTQNVTPFTWDLVDSSSIIIDYVIIRRTGSSQRLSSGRMTLVSNPDGATDADKWILLHPIKQDDPLDVGVTFTITVTAGVVQVKYTTDNMAGTSHACTIYYRLINFSV
jgi:hypothetical protein